MSLNLFLQIMFPACIKCSLTLAFCKTLPFVAIMEAGLFLRAEAELTGEAESALLLLEGWQDDAEDGGDNDDWGLGKLAVLGCGEKKWLKMVLFFQREFTLISVTHTRRMLSKLMCS